MESLVKHIEYLIGRNDCVIIPGFGAILAQRQDAELADDASTLNPPKRVFTYNSVLNKTDGALAYSISRKDGISYANALSRINSQVESMNRLLISDGHLEMGRIGTFTYDTDANAAVFEPAYDNSLSSETYGLPAVVQQYEQDSAPTDRTEPNIVKLRTTPFVRFAKAAASIALLIALCFVESTPISIDEATFASLSPAVKPISESDLLPTEKVVQPSSPVAFIDSEIRDTYSAELSEPALLIDSDIRCTYNPAIEQEQWIIVVGSFARESEVRAFLEQRPSKGYSYYKKGNNYRVYSAAYSTSEEAYKAFARDGYKMSEAWITKM